jgi:hypothetical protein
MRFQISILSACLFAIAGLVIPSHYQAEAAGAGNLGKTIKYTGMSSGDCAGQKGGLQTQDDCKADSKSSKVDLDRKGHKVKKSKSRGR